MPVTDDIVATFRAYLSGDMEQWERLRKALDLDNTHAKSRAYFAFLTASFAMAVERRFNASTPREEIIAFVADLRARDEKWAERLDPDATERMIAMIFDDNVETDDIPRLQTIGIRMIVSAAIVRDDDLDSAELEDFLDKSRTLGNEVLS